MIGCAIRAPGIVSAAGCSGILCRILDGSELRTVAGAAHGLPVSDIRPPGCPVPRRAVRPDPLRHRLPRKKIVFFSGKCTPSPHSTKHFALFRAREKTKRPPAFFKGFFCGKAYTIALFFAAAVLFPGRLRLLSLQV